MRNRFDQLAKQLGQAALGPSGITVVNDPINPETQYADLRHEPDPVRQAARDQLGLLGRILLEFQRVLGQHESRTSDEQEFLMAMQQTWEDARTEGRTEGRTETRADDVLTVLRVRGLAVPDAARRQIQAERDLARLERWLERAIVASSVAEVLDDAS